MQSSSIGGGADSLNHRARGSGPTITPAALIVPGPSVEAAADGAIPIIPSVDHIHLGPEVYLLRYPAVGPSRFGGAAGRGVARGIVATSRSWPNGPTEETAVTARTTTSEAVAAAISGQPRAIAMKKPSASPSGSALLQHPPSRSTFPTASVSPRESSCEKAIAMMVTVMLGPRAGSHTPATEGTGDAGTLCSSTGGEGAAEMRIAPCRTSRSHQPASWTPPPPGLCPTCVSTIPRPRCAVIRSAGTVGMQAPPPTGP